MVTVRTAGIDGEATGVWLRIGLEQTGDISINRRPSSQYFLRMSTQIDS